METSNRLKAVIDEDLNFVCDNVFRAENGEIVIGAENIMLREVRDALDTGETHSLEIFNSEDEKIFGFTSVVFESYTEQAGTFNSGCGFKLRLLKE